MPDKCSTCNGTGKVGTAAADGSLRCPDCKGAGEKLSAGEHRIALLVLTAIVVLSAVFVWVLRQTG